MSHGTPDWGHAKGKVSHALTDDLAELAARLGSIHTYDRRGDVIWWDDFSNGLEAWDQITGGTGAEIVSSTTFPMWPPNCAKLTGGSSSTWAAVMYYYQGLPILQRLGWEVAVNFASDWDVFYIGLTMYDGSTYNRGAIMLSDADTEVKYLDEAGSYTALGTLPELKSTTGTYHHLKLVVDFEDDKYVRFLLNETEYDLSAYASRSLASTAAPQLRCRVDLRSRDGENDYCNVDGVILTQDEP